jgi:hypothetical protein
MVFAMNLHSSELMGYRVDSQGLRRRFAAFVSYSVFCQSLWVSCYVSSTNICLWSVKITRLPSRGMCSSLCDLLVGDGDTADVVLVLL